jgi:hypothetical protein
MIRIRPVPAASNVVYQPWRPRIWVSICIGAAVAGISLGIALSTLREPGPFGQYEYHLWKWEAATLLDNVFARMGIGPSPDDSAGLAAVQQYFKLTSQIRAATNSEHPDEQLLDTLTSERAAYENDVERLIERYIGEAVASAGLQRRLPLFHAVKLTWPPPDFELTSPPRLLVRSPRDHIEREGDTLLKAGLTLQQIDAIERQADNSKTVSLVVSIGGIAAYPAIVRDDRSFDSMLETASHEWVHHYLAFYPLGEQWGKGGDAEALNETTANIAGRGIAALIQKRHPIELPQGEDGSAPAAPPSTVDFSKEMHDLRVQVDALLAAGQVAEAESAMEAKRVWLEQNGISIRKLNQAYFAFYGTYADTAASTNPIGPKIQHVWDLTGDVGAFLASMRGVTSGADLDRLIFALEAGKK